MIDIINKFSIFEESGHFILSYFRGFSSKVLSSHREEMSLSNVVFYLQSTIIGKSFQGLLYIIVLCVLTKMRDISQICNLIGLLQGVVPVLDDRRHIVRYFLIILS